MANVTEIAPDLFRISVFAEWGNLQFNHFLIPDEEPLLFHTGLRGMFPEIREVVSKLIPLDGLRHISFSHFESDECGRDLQPGGRTGERERFYRPRSASTGRWTDIFHGKI